MESDPLAGFFQHFISYSYYKRNDPELTHQQLTQLVGVSRPLTLHLPGLPFVAENDDLNKPPEPDPTPEEPPRGRSRWQDMDEDSDDALIKQEYRGIVYLLQTWSVDLVDSIFEFIAKYEIKKLKPYDPDLRKLLFLERRQDPLPPYLRTDFDTFKILVGYRKILFEIYNKDLNRRHYITYMSMDGGCLIWFENNVQFVKGIKYQSRAARDFFYLARSQHCDELIIDVEPYRNLYPLQWPFDSFFAKCAKYFDSIEKFITTRKLSMTLFPSYRIGANEPTSKALASMWSITVASGYQFTARGLAKVAGLEVAVFDLWDDSKIRRARGIRSARRVPLPTHFTVSVQWDNIKEVAFPHPDFYIVDEQYWRLGRLKKLSMYVRCLQKLVWPFSNIDNTELHTCQVFVQLDANFEEFSRIVRNNAAVSCFGLPEQKLYISRETVSNDRYLEARLSGNRIFMRLVFRTNPKQIVFETTASMAQFKKPSLPGVYRASQRSKRLDQAENRLKRRYSQSF